MCEHLKVIKAAIESSGNMPNLPVKRFSTQG